MVLDLIEQYTIQNPKIAIIIFAAIVSLFISLINFFMLDKERMREIKARQKELQVEMKQHQKDGNQDKVMELQKEMFSSIGETFKHSLKPMIITIIPVLILFAFIRNLFAETALASSWFWWYLGAALGSSLIFRKLFKLP